MTTIEHQIEINAPISRVFQYAADYHNWPAFFTGVSDFKPTSEITRGNGSRFSYQAKLLGMSTNVETEITEFVENSGWKGISIKGIKCQTQWIFRHKNERTNFTYILGYELPIPILGNIMDILFIKPAWNKIISESLGNLKIIMELNTSG